MTANDDKRPVFLDSYDFIGKLQEWSAAGPPEQKRHWSMMRCQYGNVRAGVTWRQIDSHGHTSKWQASRRQPQLPKRPSVFQEKCLP